MFKKSNRQPFADIRRLLTNSLDVNYLNFEHMLSAVSLCDQMSLVLKRA